MACSCQQRKEKKSSALLLFFGLSQIFLLLPTTSCNEVPFPATVTCSTTEQNFALFDGRLQEEYGQCRVGCETFSNHHINISHIPTNCSIWTSKDHDVQVFLSASQKRICIPRGFCIKECGEEEQGCVYSGSCTSQTCFKSIATGEPANLTRITYSGQRSYVSTDLGSTERDLDQPRVLFGMDGCQVFANDPNGEGFLVERVVENCDPSKPFVDNRAPGDKKRQCRSICKKFSDERVEVVRLPQTCPICWKTGLDAFLNVTLPICIPNKKCVEECKDPSPGCVYLGTCRHQYCLSGIDSKKPAVIDMGDDDSGSTISYTVDNSGPPISIDPPAYAQLPLSIDYSPTPTESSSAEPSPTSLKSPEPSQPQSSPSATPAPVNNEASQKEENSTGEKSGTIWVWLGPLLGLIVAAMIGFAGTVAAALIRNRAPQTDKSTTDGGGIVPDL